MPDSSASSNSGNKNTRKPPQPNNHHHHLPPAFLSVDDLAHGRQSKIFEWFGEDWVPIFGVEEGFAGSKDQKAVLNFISQYVDDSDRAYLEAGAYDIKYTTYNWNLNRRP